MKKLFFLFLLVSLSMSSCMYLGNFGKRPLYLVGAPDDIVVKHKGKKVDIKEARMSEEITKNNGYSREKIRYYIPAAYIKVRRENKLELSSGGKTVNVTVKGKVGKGIVFLVLEAPITLGIGTIVDLATTSYYHPASKYVDVYGAFTGKTTKSKKELYEFAKKCARKELITEVRTN